MSTIGPGESPSFWVAVYSDKQSQLERAAEMFFDIEPENFKVKPNSDEKRVYKQTQDYTMSNWSRAWNVFLRIVILPVTVVLGAAKLYYRNKHVYQIDNWETYQAHKKTNTSNPSEVAQRTLASTSVAEVAHVNTEARAGNLLNFCKIVRVAAGHGLPHDSEGAFLTDGTFLAKPAAEKIEVMKTWIEKNSDKVTNLNLNPEELKKYQLDITLKAIPEEIGMLTELKTLSALNLGIDTLPPEVGNLQKLTHLNLDGNKLVTLPEEIGKCSNLHELRVANNSLKSLPESIGILHALRVVDIKDNPISELPQTFFSLPNLTNLFQNTMNAGNSWKLLSEYPFEENRKRLRA